MPYSKKHAQKLLREMPDDPEELLNRPNYRDPVFLDVYFEHCYDVIFHEPRAGLKHARVAFQLAPGHRH